MNYETLKRLARERSCRVTELIALAPKNDPFYTGSPGDISQAQWFAALWRRFGYSHGVHLRRLHYACVSADPPVSRPDGKPYQNTENDWDFLNEASKAARYLGCVDPAAFVDRRNPDPRLYADYWQDPTPSVEVCGAWNFDMALPEFPALPRLVAAGYEGMLQPIHQELWCEKTTVQDVLEPVCRQYDVNLVMGAGELSITAVLALLDRVERARRPTMLWYISDYDPAGYGMPVSVARKIEFFACRQGLEHRILLQPLALTSAQVRRYSLPRVPIKDSELRRGKFEDIHGAGAVELDALEALHPGALARIVKAAVLRYYDPTLTQRALEQRAALQDKLRRLQEEALEDLQPEVAALKEEYEGLLGRVGAAFETLRKRLEELRGEIEARLEAVSVDLGEYPLPDAQVNPLDSEDILYDSNRSYPEQLESYRAYRTRQDGGHH